MEKELKLYRAGGSNRVTIPKNILKLLKIEKSIKLIIENGEVILKKGD
jgi:antitoxin component of MazEF toxin-antitoxin module